MDNVRQDMLCQQTADQGMPGRQVDSVRQVDRWTMSDGSCCVCRLLIRLSQSTSDPDRRAALNEVACTLFFHLTVQVCEETNFYPPTKQFFASCVEILGQVGRWKDRKTQTLLSV